MSELSSILAVDFGSVYTRALLIDVVDGVYRLVARAHAYSSGGFPAGDVSIGLQQAAAQITAVTGRQLLNDDGRIVTPEGDNRIGVDHFIATASGARALRTVLVGLVPDVSVESGIRATEGTYVDVVDVLSLEDGQTEEDRLNVLLKTQPDLVFITGGTEDGAREPVLRVVRMVRQSIGLTETENRPSVLYAGNSNLADDVRETFGNLTKVFVAENVRPFLDEENLDSAQLQLGLAFDEYISEQGNGFDNIAEMSSIGLLPSAQSYSIITEYLGKAQSNEFQGIVTLDVGSTTSTLSTHFAGDTHTSIRTEIGLGQSAPGILAAVGADAIRNWLPFNKSRVDLHNYALNKSLRPYTLPATLEALFLEYAFLRAGVRAMIEGQRMQWATSKPDIDLIVAGGSTMSQTGNPGLTAMLMLDTVQPSGVTTLIADPNALIPAMGAISYVQPEAVVQLLEADNLDRIGTAISVDGSPRLGRAALDIRIDIEDGERLGHKMNGGELFVFQLSPGKNAQVKVSVARGSGLRIGGRRSVTMNVRGGQAGLIFDTRGRPIPLASDVRKRSLQLVLWLAQATGNPPVEIEESMLDPVEEKPEVVSVRLDSNSDDGSSRDQKPRRGLFGRRQAEPEETPEVSLEDLLGEDDENISDEDLFGLFEEEGDFDDLRR